jgi:hypothetical protein
MMMAIGHSVNLDAAQRQNARNLPVLCDRAGVAKKIVHEQRMRKRVVYAYGNFLASLIPSGGWWVTVTLRDRSQPFQMRRLGRRTLRGRIMRHYRDCFIRYGHPDDRIKTWRPASKLNRPWSPFTYKILTEVRLFMEMLEASAGMPIGFIVAEEIGDVGGRWHLHLLVSGVPSDVPRKVWWSAAFQIWGRTRIEPYDPRKAAAFYAAKYAAKQLGAIHLCGTLCGVRMNDCEDSARHAALGGHDVVSSAFMPSGFFHSPLGSFRKPEFAGTLPARVWRQSRTQNWIHFKE